jgi:hypothetical protein
MEKNFWNILYKLFCSCGNEKTSESSLKNCPQCKKKVDKYLKVDVYHKKEKQLIGFTETFTEKVLNSDLYMKLPVRSDLYFLENEDNIKNMKVNVSTSYTYYRIGKESGSYGIESSGGMPLDKKFSEVEKEFNLFDQSNLKNTQDFAQGMIDIAKITFISAKQITNELNFNVLRAIYFQPTLDTFLNLGLDNLTETKYEENNDDTIISLQNKKLIGEEQPSLLVNIKSGKFFLEVGGEYFDAEQFNILNKSQKQEIYHYLIHESNYRLDLMYREKLNG